MIEKRLYKFSELTALGMSHETLRVWRRDDADFPKPVFKKFYDIKTIEAYLDKKGGITAESQEPDWNQIFMENLNNNYQS